MFSKISVLVPTRRRIGRLETLLRSYDENGGDSHSELIFRADEDDVETLSFLDGKKVIVGSRLNGYWSLPTFFNDMASASDGDVLMCGNDDMIFRTPGWAEILLNVANQYSDGVFNLGVSTHNETHYPFSTVSRVVVQALGFIWDPRIFWGDIFLRDLMGHFGRCVMVPSIRIDHDWVGFKPDVTFNEGKQDQIWTKDPTYWEGTHARAVNDAINKLKECLEWSACASQS